MKIVLAPDKFKNSLTGMQFCNVVEAGIKAVLPNAEVLKLPLADGGDGTIGVVDYYLKGQPVAVIVNDPFFRKIKANYIYAKTSKTAFIEMAEASGVKLLKSEELDCINTTTIGTGELILDAIKKGATKIILGIGGSATNDCGIGMAKALGYRFLDENDKEVVPIGANLSKIKAIDTFSVHPRLHKVDFQVACDVTNPLYGENGAAHIYAAQKGATPKDIDLLDKGLQSFAQLLSGIFNLDVQAVKGAGAAGGMGIASKVFLKGHLEPGIELIKRLAQFDEKIKGADWIITGEGKLDTQTLSGKTIKGVLDAAITKRIKVATFCGGIDLDETSPKALGIHYADTVMYYAKNLKDAMENSTFYLRQMAKKFALTLLKS
ncbi:glycerate kinase [Flavobacteriaceae bacterium MHTCC 0001]